MAHAGPVKSIAELSSVPRPPRPTKGEKQAIDEFLCYLARLADDQADIMRQAITDPFNAYLRGQIGYWKQLSAFVAWARGINERRTTASDDPNFVECPRCSLRWRHRRSDEQVPSRRDRSGNARNPTGAGKALD